MYTQLSLQRKYFYCDQAQLFWCACVYMYCTRFHWDTNEHTHTQSLKENTKILRICVWLYYIRARTHSIISPSLTHSLTHSLRTATTNYGQLDTRVAINLMLMQNHFVHRQKRYVLEGGAGEEGGGVTTCRYLHLPVGSEAQEASSMIFWLVLISSLFVLLLLVRRPPLNEICPKCTFHLRSTSSLPLSRHFLFPFSIMLQ